MTYTVPNRNLKVLQGVICVIYEEFFNFGDQFTALRFIAPSAAYREGHMNFADESACLMADNVWNEGK
jgi:hypothetical protein